ncbi:NUDIX hydrolase [Asticcacaulis sp. BYS171W]|uniref:GDP-mannose pyrophosphatase n=1 Tax=Asticcacaulis aquaticus TaxID=2984212 RepID=A0ABT5HRP6_9CAUL|nr:NUDIX hydrolase [Asticcacaulis aquaticus]MDC7682505.1 NUDIX hydrolase [Asticcacaulis aquaticus]
MTIERPLPPWDSVERDALRPRWTRVTSEIAFETPWIRVERADVIAPTGKPGLYGLVHFANRAVGVLPMHDDGTVTLVGQMRFAFDAWSWEMPEGGVPFGESPLDGAKRELREEAGLIAAHWQEILNFDVTNSVADEVAVCYLATGLTVTEAEPDDTEKLEIVRIPFKDVLEAVIKGQIRDSLTVATVLRVYHMAVTGALPEALARLIK